MKKIWLLSILILFIIAQYKVISDDNPNIYVTELNNPAPGYLFVSPFTEGKICLIDNSGNIVHTKLKFGSIGIADLKVQKNGLITYYDFMAGKFYGMNENYEIVDSFQCVNSIKTDFHDIQVLSNGHVLLIGEIDSIINMKNYVPNGNERARVMGFVIQELDESKKLVFQWNTFDHFKITDATEDVDLTASTILYVHCNAIEKDIDGHLLLSNRHLDEVTKINRNTGDIIWRLGGSKCRNNQFTFLNDTIDNFFGFSHQHDVRRLSNGNLLMLDNGTLKTYPYTRAVEYKLDEQNKTITKVWEYRKDPDEFVPWLGNAQRLPNGNTLIGWGGTSNIGEGDSNDSLLIATEVKPDNTIAFEVRMDNVKTYRVFRFPIKMEYNTKIINSIGSYSFYSNTNTYIKLDITNLNGSGSLTIEKHNYIPFNLSFSTNKPCFVLPYRWVISKDSINSISGTIKIDLSFILEDFFPEHYSIFKRNKEATGSFTKLDTYYDQENNVLYANFNDFGEFAIGCDYLPAPSTFSPILNSGTIPTNTPISWNHKNGAERYNFQLSTSEDFKNIIIDSLVNDTINLFNLNYNSTYYWHVKSINDVCSSEWSETVNFTTILRSISLSSPINNSLSDASNGKLIWNYVDGAEQYIVQIALDSSFKNIVLNKYTNNLEYIFDELQYNTQYFWRVKAINTKTQSEWSEIWSFWTVLPSPKLHSPPNAQRGRQISGRLSWEVVNGAEYYNIQISTDQYFEYNTIIADGISNLYYDYSDFINDTTYYWRVRAVNKIVKSNWSNVWTFRTVIPPPFLEYPDNQALDIPTDGVLKWKPVNNASNYILQLSYDVSFQDIIYEDYNIITNTISINTLEKNKTYFWRLKSQNIDGISQWSEVWSFITQPEYFLDIPKLSIPINNSINIRTSGSLHWNKAQGAESYWIQISNSPLFKYNLSNENNITTNNFSFQGLNHNTKYYWRVASQSKHGTSNWSEVWEFTTNLASPILKYPTNQQSNVPLDVTLEWNPSFGANTYFFQISDDSRFDNIINETIIDNSTQYEIKGLMPETFYWWHIKAINGMQESDWSLDWFFTTNDNTSVDEQGSYQIKFATAFPNPFSDKIIIMINNLNSPTIIQVFNTIGHEVLTINIADQQIAKLIELDASSLPTGSYYYKITSGRYYKWGNLIKLK